VKAHSGWAIKGPDGVLHPDTFISDECFERCAPVGRTGWQVENLPFPEFRDISNAVCPSGSTVGSVSGDEIERHCRFEAQRRGYRLVAVTITEDEA